MATVAATPQSEMLMPSLQTASFKVRRRTELKKYADPNNPHPKWDHQELPPTLADYMNEFLEVEEDRAEWKSDLVAELKDWLDERIASHIKVSSKSRTRLSVMNQENVWANAEKKIIKLTRRNLATLDQTLIPHLNKHLHSVLKDRTDEIRTEIRLMLSALYASDDDLAAADEVMMGTDETDYTIERYGEHLQLQKELRHEVQEKIAVIECLRYREALFAELVNWEARNRNVVANLPKQNSIGLLNFQAKFRVSVVGCLDAATTKGKKLIAEYEKETGLTFRLRGVVYADYLAKQAAQAMKVKTNFSSFTHDVLFFREFTGEENGGGAIARRLLHSDLESIVADGRSIPDPPSMPECAEEVGFAPLY